MSSHDDSNTTNADLEMTVSKKRNREKQVTASTVGDDVDDDVASFFSSSDLEHDAGDAVNASITDSNSIGEQNEEQQQTENLQWGKGIRQDWQNTTGAHWAEEMTNFKSKTVAVTIFMFFAAMAPAITFGAIYEKTTGHYIGTVEMLTATAWVGIVYSLLGGQPIMINGGTGPVLAFSGVLYKLAASLEVPFLTLSAWVGLWVMVFNVLAAIVNLNRLILYATRFTDEIFAMLISVIFIINALGNPFAPVGLYYYFDPSHGSHEDHIDDESYSYLATAFWSLILAIGTTALALFFKDVKFSRYLCNQWSRNGISDFAVSIAILVFTVLDHTLFRQVETEKLNVPDTLAPTFTCCTSSCDSYWPTDCPHKAEPYGRRSWMVDLFDLRGKNYVPFMAAIPAFLAFILVFLDDGITLHLINHPSHKLTHGDAYNLNTLVIGLMVGVNSLFGFPWLVAATVRSVNHLHALAEKNREGKIESVLETRLTNLFVHIIILCSLFVLPLLQLIPVPVLYGIFLFMGLTSLSTNQFWARFLMIFMQPSNFPKEPYTEYVDAKRMHLYTAIQIILFSILLVVKSAKPIAIAFPIIIALCIPVRLFLLPKWFLEHELIMLDSEDEKIKECIERMEGTQRRCLLDEEQPSDCIDENKDLNQSFVADEREPENTPPVVSASWIEWKESTERRSLSDEEQPPNCDDNNEDLHLMSGNDDPSLVTDENEQGDTSPVSPASSSADLQVLDPDETL